MERTTSRSPRYIATLALVSSAILILGWLARPREIAQGPPPLPSEGELAQLARRAERRSLDSMAAYFAVTADDVEASVVRLPGMGASGIAWDSRTIVTAPLSNGAPDTVALRWSSGEDAVQPAIWGPRLPLAVMSTGRGLPGLSPARRAPTLPQAGSWVVAVWRSERERAFATGSYIQSAAAACGRWRVQEVVSSLALSRVMAGGGLFDIDGGLLAVVLPCGDRLAAIATANIDTILAEAQSLEQQVLARYGVTLSPLTDGAKALMDVKAGLMVSEVWTGHRGDRAGLMPGDVIVEVDGSAVTALENATPMAAEPDEDGLALTVRRRGAKPLVIVLPPRGHISARVSEATPGPGVVWESPLRSYAIETVVPGSRAAAAGLEPGDRLVRINQAEPRSLADIRRVLDAKKPTPALLEVQRGDRRVAVILR